MVFLHLLRKHSLKAELCQALFFITALQGFERVKLSGVIKLLVAYIVKKAMRISLRQIAVPESFRPFLCSTKPSEIRVILWGYTRKIIVFYSSYLEKWRSKFTLSQRDKWSEQGLEGAILILMVLGMLSCRGPARYFQPLIDMVSCLS